MSRRMVEHPGTLPAEAELVNRKKGEIQPRFGRNPITYGASHPGRVLDYLTLWRRFRTAFGIEHTTLRPDSDRSVRSSSERLLPLCCDEP